MNPLKALQKFFTSNVTVDAPMDDAFVQIDREGLVKSMRLKERGAEQGTLQLPRENDATMDVAESEIISRIGEELEVAQINVRNHTQAYDNRLSDLKLLHELGTIRAAAKKATGDFETLVIDWKNRLSNRRDAIVDSYRDLQSFRAANGLTRPAVEVPSKIVTLGSIAVSFLVEIFGNTIFLRVNDDLGYLGGVIAAFMVAAINIGLGIVVGYLFWPRTHLHPGFQRNLAWAVISLWLLFLPVWNLAAAHFRDAKSAGLEDPQKQAIRLLIEQPFGLEGLYSWGLFLIGVVAALIAARSAYSMDDPFPGYGERWRHHRVRCEEYAEEVAEANRQLTGVRDDAIHDAEGVKRQLGVQSRERTRIHSAYRRFVRRFEQHQDRLEEAANYLLATYRDANRRSRTEPEPGHFSLRYELGRSVVEPLHDEAISDSEISSAEQALKECIDEVVAAFRVSIGRFEPLDQLKKELERGTL